ncbi:MAG: methyltransferase domain-containing protein [Acidimicrobiia bacterium]|nr:methyltransferase domain-containing protein [Acidimicrobiia bacterium]
MYERFADVYDVMNRGAGKDYEAEAAAVAELVRARRPDAQSLLDVACGTGEHLRHLQQWLAVEGLELSEHMAAIARAKLGPDVPVHAGDMRSFDLGRTFDAVTCMFSSIGYARDAAQLQRAVTTMAKHLAPGGVLVFDAWLLPEQWHDGHRVAHAVNEADVALARLDTSYRQGRDSVLDFHFVVATSDGVDRFTERHELTMHTAAEYEAALRSAGCAPETVPGLPDGRLRYVGVRSG